jgi:hypothetical protein
MKQVKLYNVIFPIWFLMFFPPVILLTLAGNFIIDSLVIIACCYNFKLINTETSIKTFYKKSILKVWAFGFLSDIIGAAILFALLGLESALGLPNKLISAISYDPFSNPVAVIIIVLAMLISSAFIFLFNYRFTFKDLIEDKKLRLKAAMTIAIVTIPWTFLIPTKLLYK